MLVVYIKCAAMLKYTNAQLLLYRSGTKAELFIKKVNLPWSKRNVIKTVYLGAG